MADYNFEKTPIGFDVDKMDTDTHLLLEQYHIFSKTPAAPTTALGGARNKAGHTTTASDIWSQDIPAFFKAYSDADLTRFASLAKKNDLVVLAYAKSATEPNGAVLKFTDGVWTKIHDSIASIPDGTPFYNSTDEKPVLRFHQNSVAVILDGDNNNTDGSNGFSAKICAWDDANNAPYAPSALKFVPQFVSPMDKMVSGIPSSGYDAIVKVGQTEDNILAESPSSSAGYIANNYAGIIHFNTAKSSNTIYVHAFEYIGTKLDASLTNIDAKFAEVKEDIQDIVGVTMEGVVASVTANASAQSAGIDVDSTTKTSPKITFTGGSVTTGETKLVSGGTVASAIDSAVKITGIQVKVGSGTAQTLTPTNKVVTIEIPEVQAAAVQGGVITTDGFVKASDAKAIAEKAIESAIADGSTIDTRIDEVITTAVADGGTIDNRIDTLISNATSTSAIVDNDTSTKLVTAKQVSDYVASEVAAVDTGVTTISVNGGAAQKGAVSITAIEGIVTPSHTDISPTSISIDNVGNKVKLTAISAGAKVSENKLSYKQDYLATAADADTIATFRAEEAKDTLDGRSLGSLASSTQGSYVSVTTSGTVGTGLTVNVNDSALASTVSAAGSAIQTVKVNNTALTKNGTEVNITALTGINDSNNASNGITLTDSIAGSTDKKLGLVVTPATYTKKSGTTPGSWENLSAGYLTTAQSVSDAISDAISAIDFPDINLDAYSHGYGISFSSHTESGAISNHYMSIATAAYTPATETGEIGTWTDGSKGYLVTGATVAAAIGDVNAKVDALHQTPQFKVEVVTGVTDLTKWEESVTDGIKENYIYLVQNPDAADGSYIEYIAYKNGGTLVTERIGTTKTDLSGYAKSVKINGQTYTATAANAGALDLGTVVTTANTSNHSGWDGTEAATLVSSPIYTRIASDGTLKQAIVVADGSQYGVSKMFSGDLSTAASTVTDTAVSVKSAQSMYSSLATLADSKVDNVLTGSYLSLAGFSVSTGSNNTEKTINLAVLSSSESLQSVVKTANPKSVEGGILTATNGVKHQIATDKIVDGTNMFATSTIETWVDDLSNMTNGTAMFKNSSLTVFVGDLSSLETADEMFMGCTLDAESLEILSENLPTVTGGTIDIGASTNATAEVIATIKGKGWTLKSNGADVA